MYGAIVGDICGSVYERDNVKTEAVDSIVITNPESTFTDDTVLTVAVADAILYGKYYGTSLHSWGNRHPHSGYGQAFQSWLHSATPQPYNSYGNGAAMRVAPVGWAFATMDQTLEEAMRTALPTHNHAEGVKGAQAVAAAVFLARNGKEKIEIKECIERTFGYDLSRTLAAIRPDYGFDSTCQGSVPEALTAFLESRDFSHALRLAISIGGDSDTIASIAGAVAEAFYRGIPKDLFHFARSRLPRDLRTVADAFVSAYLPG